MKKKPKNPKDTNKLAKHIVDLATKETAPNKKSPKKIISEKKQK